MTDVQDRVRDTLYWLLANSEAAEAEAARAWLKRAGLSLEEAEERGYGYVPSDRCSFTEFLREKGVDGSMLVGLFDEQGLVSWGQAIVRLDPRDGWVLVHELDFEEGKALPGVRVLIDEGCEVKDVVEILHRCAKSVEAEAARREDGKTHGSIFETNGPPL